MNGQSTETARTRAGTNSSAEHGVIGEALTLPQLSELCNGQRHGRRGDVDVLAVLAYSPGEGFFLSAQDGPVVHVIVDDSSSQLRFRTIDMALVTLGAIAGLHPCVGVFQISPVRSVRH